MKGLLPTSLLLMTRWKGREMVRLEDTPWLTDWSRGFCPDHSRVPSGGTFPVLILDPLGIHFVSSLGPSVASLPPGSSKISMAQPYGCLAESTWEALSAQASVGHTPFSLLGCSLQHAVSACAWVQCSQNWTLTGNIRRACFCNLTRNFVDSYVTCIPGRHPFLSPPHLCRERGLPARKSCIPRTRMMPMPNNCHFTSEETQRGQVPSTGSLG